MIKKVGKDRYQFVVNIGSGANRRRPSTTITHKGGKKELQRLYDEFAAECENAEPTADITVESLLEDYIAHCKVLGRSAETIRSYKITAGRCYEPLGTILAKDLTTYRLEKFVALMVDNGLSSKSIKNTIGLLSAAYNHAVKVGQLSQNPCKRVTLPKANPRDIRILYMDEIPKFLEAISECDLNERCAYELALFLGLRRSEIIGLKESDVDIVNGMLSVHSTRHRTNGEDYEQGTKTDKSTRVLALPDILLIDLAKLMQMHRDSRYTSTDYLIQNGVGDPLNGQALSSRLDRLEEKKGLPHVTLHGLRHTYASILNANGVDMAMISRELGHSNITTTANIYTHILKTPTQSSRNIASTVDTFLQGSDNSAKKLPISDK